MSWCPNDSSYLLTCAKDNRTICWDTNSAEIVSELPAGTNWNFDVHWYPKIPGVISASSFDGKISIYNIEACARYGVGESYLVSMNPSYKRTTIDNLFDGINKTFAVVGKVLPGV